MAKELPTIHKITITVKADHVEMVCQTSFEGGKKPTPKKLATSSYALLSSVLRMMEDGSIHPGGFSQKDSSSLSQILLIENK